MRSLCSPIFQILQLGDEGAITHFYPFCSLIYKSLDVLKYGLLSSDTIPNQTIPCHALKRRTKSHRWCQYCWQKSNTDSKYMIQIKFLPAFQHELLRPSLGRGSDLMDLTGTEVTEGKDGPQSLVIDGVTLSVRKNFIFALFPSLPKYWFPFWDIYEYHRLLAAGSNRHLPHFYSCQMVHSIWIIAHKSLKNDAIRPRKLLWVD